MMKKYKDKTDGWLNITHRYVNIQLRGIRENPDELMKLTRTIREQVVRALEADANPTDPRCDTICPEGKADLRRIALHADAILEGKLKDWDDKPSSRRLDFWER